MISELRKINKAYERVSSKLDKLNPKRKIAIKRMRKRQERLFNLFQDKLPKPPTPASVIDFLTDVATQELKPYKR